MIVGENATLEDLLAAGMTEGDAEQVLGFREFLRVADRAADGKIHLAQPYYDYAIGKIHGGELLERLAAARLTDEQVDMAADGKSDFPTPEQVDEDWRRRRS